MDELIRQFHKRALLADKPAVAANESARAVLEARAATWREAATLATQAQILMAEREPAWSLEP